MKIINLWKMKTISVDKHSEVVCDKCDGLGVSSAYKNVVCPKCMGAGKLDWVERIVGKPNEFNVLAFRETLNDLAKDLADTIDKEIMDQIIKYNNKF